MTDLRSALRAEIALRDRMAFAIPLPAAAHEILLQVALAHVEGRWVSIAGASGGIPSATALRHVRLLVEAGLIRREPARNDYRSVWLLITDEGFARIEALFAPPAVVRAA